MLSTNWYLRSTYLCDTLSNFVLPDRLECIPWSDQTTTKRADACVIFAWLKCNTQICLVFSRAFYDWYIVHTWIPHDFWYIYKIGTRYLYPKYIWSRSTYIWNDTVKCLFEKFVNWTSYHPETNVAQNNCQEWIKGSAFVCSVASGWLTKNSLNGTLTSQIFVLGNKGRISNAHFKDGDRDWHSFLTGA